MHTARESMDSKLLRWTGIAIATFLLGAVLSTRHEGIRAAAPAAPPPPPQATGQVT